jgi:hypothetical protein
VTDPAHPFEAQFIPLPGGRIHRDVHVFHDTNTGKSYAYVGGQEDSDLWVVDLSYLPGLIPSTGVKNLGYRNAVYAAVTLARRSGRRAVVYEQRGKDLRLHHFRCGGKSLVAAPTDVAMEWRGRARCICAQRYTLLVGWLDSQLEPP